MGHYAKVLNGKVIKVIVAQADFFDTFIDDGPGEWIKTSYNTYGNQHRLGGTPLRGNFAGKGHIYDKQNDVFYSPQPFPSWTLNTSTWTWEPPVPRPSDENPNADPPVLYVWDEESTYWVRYNPS